MLSVLLAALDSEEARNEFSLIYEKYRDPLLGYAFKYVQNTSDAEDAVHDVFQIAASHWQRLSKRGELGIKRFLFICVRNRALNMLKRRSRVVSLEGLEESGSVIFADPIEDDFYDALADEEVIEEAKEIIDSFDKETADAFIMFLAGFSAEETAECFDEKPDTIRKRLYRAKLRLREALAAKGGDAR